MLRLFHNKESRNGYKVAMLPSHLGVAFERVAARPGYVPAPEI